VIDHNPFFLISGLLMLVGCFTINGAAHGDPSAIWPIAGLILLFNLYEALLIGLAVYLSGPRKLYRDAACLILLEALLLCDVSLAYSELMMKSLPMGIIFNATAVALVGLKIHLIGRALGLRLTKTGWAGLMAVFILMFGLPGLFRELTRLDLLEPNHFYAAWWAVGLAAVLTAVSRPWFTSRRSHDPAKRKLILWTKRCLIALPLASLALHLRAAHYIDDEPFYLFNLSPMILGVTAAWVHLRARSHRVSDVAAVTLFAGGVAVALSTSFPNSVIWSVFPDGSMPISPLRLTLIATAALGVYAWCRRGVWVCLPAALSLLFAAGLGHRVSVIEQSLNTLWRKISGVLSMFIPDTALGWGYVAVAFSFLFLALGAVASMIRHPSRHPPGTP
jgi:hypothetical protein